MGHFTNPDREYRLLQQRLDRNITGAPDSPVFMQILKMARAGATARNGKANVDDYVDGAAYAALACEAAVEATLNKQADREEEHYHSVFAGIRAAAATQSAEPAPEAAA